MDTRRFVSVRDITRPAPWLDIRVSFNKGARDAYLKFAYSSEALWRANFRDLNSSTTRMEGDALRKAWGGFNAPGKADTIDLHQWLPPETLDNIDLFDQLQLAFVIRICQNSRSLAEAGRTLFNVSRGRKSSVNDSHRVSSIWGDLGWGLGSWGGDSHLKGLQIRQILQSV